MKMEIDRIKKGLIKSCLNGEPKSFIPFLLSPNVQTEMPNKMRFYRSFKYMINCAIEKSIGNWTLKIEKTQWNKDNETLAYKFYDEKHKYSRLTIMVREKEDEIYLEIMPF